MTIKGLCPPSTYTDENEIATQQGPILADRKNSGKAELHTLYPEFLRGMSRVWTKNKGKYPDRPDGTPNWHGLWGDSTIKVVTDSARRHILAILDGEIYDQETGELHSDHVGANMQMLCKYFNDLKKNIDKKEEI